MDEGQTEPAEPCSGAHPADAADATGEAPTDDGSPYLSHDPYRVFRDTGVGRFLLAGMAATLGNQMQGVAVSWEVYARTKSPMALGMVGLAQVLPVLLLAIPFGQSADRYNRKVQVIIAQCTLMIASLGLTWVSAFQKPVEWTYLFLVFTGIGQAMNRPAQWAMLSQIVPRHLLVSAVTWNSSTWQIAAMAGPALGGFVVYLTDRVVDCYVFTAVQAAIVILLVAPLKLRPAERDAQPLSLQSLFAGLEFVFKTDLILATITLDLLAVFLGGAIALLPIFAQDILQTGPRGLGVLRAAIPIGSFLMALAQAHRPPLKQAGKTLLWAVAGFGAATIIFGLSRNSYLSFAMLVLCGAFDNISVIVRQALVQMLTPEEMRGRVSAVNVIFISSSNELGEFESGVAAALLGTVPAVVVGGLGTILVVAAVAFLWPSLTRLGSLNELKTRRL